MCSRGPTPDGNQGSFCGKVRGSVLQRNNEVKNRGIRFYNLTPGLQFRLLGGWGHCEGGGVVWYTAAAHCGGWGIRDRLLRVARAKALSLLEAKRLRRAESGHTKRGTVRVGGSEGMPSRNGRGLHTTKCQTVSRKENGFPNIADRSSPSPSPNFHTRGPLAPADGSQLPRQPASCGGLRSRRDRPTLPHGRRLLDVSVPRLSFLISWGRKFFAEKNWLWLSVKGITNKSNEIIFCSDCIV